jgi:hypothetical protein
MNKNETWVDTYYAPSQFHSQLETLFSIVLNTCVKVKDFLCYYETKELQLEAEKNYIKRLYTFYENQQIYIFQEQMEFQHVRLNNTVIPIQSISFIEYLDDRSKVEYCGIVNLFPYYKTCFVTILHKDTIILRDTYEQLIIFKFIINYLVTHDKSCEIETIQVDHNKIIKIKSLSADRVLVNS